MGVLKGWMPGKRTLKTALTVLLCMLLGHIGPLNSPFFMALAGIITMQVSTIDSFKMGKARILGTAVGATTGLAFALVGAGNPLLVALGIIVVIHVCDKLHWNQSIQISTIVFMAIMVNIGEQTAFVYSVSRLVDTAAGVLIALAVNYFIWPYSNLPLIKKEMSDALAHLDALNASEQITAEDVAPLRQLMLTMRDQIKLYELEGSVKNSGKDLLPELMAIFDHIWDAFEHQKQIYRIERDMSVRGCPNCTTQDSCSEGCSELFGVLRFHQAQARQHATIAKEAFEGFKA